MIRACTPIAGSAREDGRTTKGKLSDLARRKPSYSNHGVGEAKTERWDKGEDGKADFFKAAAKIARPGGTAVALYAGDGSGVFANLDGRTHIAFEKAKLRAEAYKKKKPRATVYQVDVLKALADHSQKDLDFSGLDVTALEVDPYGAPFEGLAAFLKRYKPARPMLTAVTYGFLNDSIKGNMTRAGAWAHLQKKVKAIAKGLGCEAKGLGMSYPDARAGGNTHTIYGAFSIVKAGGSHVSGDLKSREAELMQKATKGSGIRVLCLSDAPYLANRLAARMPAGVLSPKDHLEMDYDGAPLCYRDAASDMIVVVGLARASGSPTKYANGIDAAEYLGSAIGAAQAGEFIATAGAVYFHQLELLEFYPRGTEPDWLPTEDTPALTAAGGQDRHRESEMVESAKRKTDWRGSKATQRAHPIDSSTKCSKCGKTAKQAGCAIHRHHKNLDVDNSAGSNVRFLCMKCHIAVHLRRGLWGTKIKKSDIGMDGGIESVPMEALGDAIEWFDGQLAAGIIRADHATPDEMILAAHTIWQEIHKRAPYLEPPKSAILALAARFDSACKSVYLDDSADPGLSSEGTGEPQETAAESLPLVSRIQKFQAGTQDPEWLYVFSLVLEPNDGTDGPLKPDSDGEIYGKDYIRKMAFGYQAKYRAAGVMHDGGELPASVARLVQSIVIDDGFTFTDPNGKTWPVGAWFLGWQIKRDSQLARQIESGKINAFSIDGLAAKVPEAIAV